MAMSRYLRSGTQSFPVSGQGNFPLNALLARYTLNLLAHSPLHTEFLEMVCDFSDGGRMVDAVEGVFAEVLSPDQVEMLRAVEDADDLIRYLRMLLEKKGTAGIEKKLRERLAHGIQSNLPPMPSAESAYEHRKSRLMATLSLAAEDMRVLECAVCYQAGGVFERYCDQYPASEWAALFSVALDMPVHAVQPRFVRGGTLDSKGLLEVQKNNIQVSEPVFNFLFGLADDFLCEGEFSIADGSVFPLDTFPVPPEEMDLLLGTLRNPAPCHLFFYGRPGTGKTELAKALAVHAGRPAFLVKGGFDGNELNRRGAIMATLGRAPKGAVIVIDEADGLLNTATLFVRKQVDKGWINNFMDECRHKVIWIANKCGAIESSVLRRFSYSLEFKKFTAVQREHAWRTQLDGHALQGVVDRPMIRRLAREYEVDAGGIASALKATEMVFPGSPSPAGEVEKTLGRLLAHHEKLSGIERGKKKLNRLTAHYDPSVLHTDFPVADLLAALQRGAGSGSGASVLFWGLPGTGKTELAKYLAQELGRELLVKRMSDLQSMWVGQTEKQIAEAFDEAEREGAILFLDEADSLILDRQTAVRSWESSQTNELLTQIENFSGICICCTNLLDRLDEAVLRRFIWKIKFLPLTDEGKGKLYRKYFQPQGRLPAAVKRALQEIRDLTPGDFKTVRLKYRDAEPAPGNECLLAALRQEVAMKRTRTSAPIGFAG